MKENRMPKSTIESIIYIAITAWIMVYIMALYNVVLASILDAYKGYGFTSNLLWPCQFNCLLRAIARKIFGAIYK